MKRYTKEDLLKQLFIGQLNESETVEFKEQWGQNNGKSLSAISNGEEIGWMIIGVDDNGCWTYPSLTDTFLNECHCVITSNLLIIRRSVMSKKACKMSSDLNTKQMKVALWQNACLNFCKFLKDKPQGFNNESGLFQNRLFILQ